jgi:hypothetical protein
MEEAGLHSALFEAGSFVESEGDEPWNDRKFFEKSAYGRVIIPFIQPKKQTLTDATIPELAV